MQKDFLFEARATVTRILHQACAKMHPACPSGPKKVICVTCNLQEQTSEHSLLLLNFDKGLQNLVFQVSWMGVLQHVCAEFGNVHVVIRVDVNVVQ